MVFHRALVEPLRGLAFISNNTKKFLTTLIKSKLLVVLRKLLAYSTNLIDYDPFSQEPIFIHGKCLLMV